MRVGHASGSNVHVRSIALAGEDSLSGHQRTSTRLASQRRAGRASPQLGPLQRWWALTARSARKPPPFANLPDEVCGDQAKRVRVRIGRGGVRVGQGIGVTMG